MTNLNTGTGRCRPTHQLSIRPVQAVIELGALADVIHTALNAVHHANRHDDPDSRIAVALPDMHVHRGIARPGHEVVLFGSDAALAAYLELDGAKRLVRRGMVKNLEVNESIGNPGERGTAYVRDRQAAKRSPGAIRRARARAARRGIELPDEIETRRPDPRRLALHFGSAVVHVCEIETKIGDQPLIVGTYGFSLTGAPAVLPIVPNRAERWVDDAA
jgi:hypothetical protein